MNNNEKAILRCWLLSQPAEKPILTFGSSRPLSKAFGSVEVYPRDLLDLLDEADSASLITAQNYRNL